jgi:hypothetical protein
MGFVKKLIGIVCAVLSIFLAFTIFNRTYGMTYEEAMKGKTVLVGIMLLLTFISYKTLKTNADDIKNKNKFVFFKLVDSESKCYSYKIYWVYQVIFIIVVSALLSAYNGMLYYAAGIIMCEIAVGLAVIFLSQISFKNVLIKVYGKENINEQGELFTLRNPKTFIVKLNSVLP